MKTCAIVLLLTAWFPAMAHAESYVCAADYTTGFYFNQQHAWQPGQLSFNQKFLVKPNSDKSVKGKWVVFEFGESIP